MTPQTIEELKTILINAGYEEQLKDIFFIEDIEPIEFDNYEIEPIEFDELY